MTHSRLTWRRTRHAAVAFVTALMAGCSGSVNEPASGAAPPTTASITPVGRSELATLPGEAQAAAPIASLPVGGGGGALKIALLLPLGGFDQTAAVAKGLKQAAEMALVDSGRTDVQLIVKDDKGSAEGAKAAAEEALKDGAEVILGPLQSRAVPGAATAAKTANVTVLSFSNDRRIAGQGVYALGFSPEQDVERIIGHAARSGKRTFAALLPDDAYGLVMEAAFKGEVARAQGTVALIEKYPAGANAMLNPSRRIVEAIKAADGGSQPIDAVFIPGGQDVLPQLGPLMTYSGFDSGKVKVLGSGAWEFAAIGNNEAFVGGWYPGTDPQGWKAFSGRFVKAFGTPPPRMASVAYDAMQLVITLSAAAPKGERFQAVALQRAAGFPGVDGQLRLNAAGFAERGLAVLEVQKVGAIVVDGAAGGEAERLSAAGSPRVN